ncbi:UNVERIFIED_CONTAM: hypothetical protein HDU68_008410 [Siphonaria sp. JEL0065]|nr:hypothetical protein HDU68_008410 [Siphonaria sp. JEL0065]
MADMNSNSKDPSPKDEVVVTQAQQYYNQQPPNTQEMHYQGQYQANYAPAAGYYQSTQYHQQYQQQYYQQQQAAYYQNPEANHQQPYVYNQYQQHVIPQHSHLNPPRTTPEPLSPEYADKPHPISIPESLAHVPPPGTSESLLGLTQQETKIPDPTSAIRKLPNQYRDESIIPVSFQKYISPKQEGYMEKFCCYCCPKKRKHRLICCGVVIVVVIVLAVLLGLYIPRFPEIKVYNVNLQNLANLDTPYSFTYKDPANPNLNEMILKMNLSMDVGTYNSNLYGLAVDEINLVANLMVNISNVYNPLRTSTLMSFGSLVKVVGKPQTTPDPSYYPSNTSQIGTG